MSPDDRDALSREVAAVLADADAEIAARRPVCKASGRCCKFDEYGHRLYVTGVELMHFAHVESRPRAAAAETPGAPRVFALPLAIEANPGGCVYQVGGLCTAREGRPLGCRVYFCDENAQAWQNDLYERYHARLAALHERFGVPYRYVEWRAGLAELNAGGGAR